MKYHKSIFNKKTLSRVLNRIGDASDPNIKEKQAIIANWIRALQSGKLDIIKETAIDQKFLDDFFVRVLGYQGVIGDSEVWNMIPQQKMKHTSNRADGALGFFSNEQEDIRAVIELKDASTDLDSPQHRRNDKRTPVQQAFGYAPEAGKSCKWVIVSNFKELRLYHRSTHDEYEVFSIEKLLEPETFKKFYFLLSKENLIAKDGESEIEKLYRNNTEEEKKISTKFYGEYKAARIHLFEHLKKNNPDKDEMLLLEKTQKILDRFIFVCFCEDKGLLPARIFRGTLEQARNAIIELTDKKWQFVQALFKAINDGKPEHDINKFDGGLFAPDEELDTLKLSDAIFEELAKITDYDFDTDLNVNILGHIFEQSISDLEEIKAEINVEKLDKKKGKRKKEGIYYTPEYITRYIVENAIGGWLEDRKKELGFYGLPELTGKDYESVKVKKVAHNDNIKRHLDFWEAYRRRLETIKVLDPACGSGAFLNQAFDYLYREGQRVNEEIAKLRGTYSLVDLDKSILSNNLYGVDLNSESVEITKLSLWLKTASKHKELTALDENIKCGNSLIDDKSIDHKAFDWEKEFPFKFDVVIGNPPYVRGDKIGGFKNHFKKHFKCYTSTADLYTYFFERGINLIKPKGMLGFISSNKFIRSNYGSNLRNILKNFTIKEIIDFGELPVFEDAATFPAILIIKKTIPSIRDKTIFTQIKSLDFLSLTDLIREKHLVLPPTAFEGENWTLSSGNEGRITEKMRDIGTPLGEYVNGEIKYGVKTGFNEAFIIDKATRDKLIESDKKPLKEIIKPVIFGDNIRKYRIDFEDKYLIVTKIGVNIDDYPAIFNHLSKFKDRLEKRSDKGNHWWELRACEYYDAFDKPKIHIPAFALESRFAYDDECLYSNAPAYIIPKDDKYLLSLLNSRALWFFLKKITPILGDETKRGRLIIRTVYFQQLPIPKISESKQQPFIEKADRMIDLNKQFQQTQKEFLDWLKIQYGLEKQSKKLESFYELHEESFFVELKKKLPKENRNLSPEKTGKIKQYFEVYQQKMVGLKNELEKTDKEIDEMVYELYGLTKEEIQIVEENVENKRL